MTGDPDHMALHGFEAGGESTVDDIYNAPGNYLDVTSGEVNVEASPEPANAGKKTTFKAAAR